MKPATIIECGASDRLIVTDLGKTVCVEIHQLDSPTKDGIKRMRVSFVEVPRSSIRDLGEALIAMVSK